MESITLKILNERNRLITVATPFALVKQVLMGFRQSTYRDCFRRGVTSEGM